MQNIEKRPRIIKESKNKIRTDFKRTDLSERMKIKYLSTRFLGEVIFKLFRFVLLFGIAFVIIFPFISKISASFMHMNDFADVTVRLIPKNPTLDTYKAIISENGYWRAFFNTALLSVICGVIQTFVCCVIGYGFAKYKFRGNKILFALVIFTMIVPHGVLQGAIFRYFNTFGITGIPFTNIQTPFLYVRLTDTFAPLILLSLGGLAFKNGLFIFMMRQFFKGVPDELEESAYIDGSGVFQTFVKVILPLSVPMMITIFLFSFSWQWTDDFYSSLLFNNMNLMGSINQVPQSLSHQMSAFPASDMFTSAIQFTCGLLILLPLIIMYLFCQRLLIQGIERSGITG